MNDVEPLNRETAEMYAAWFRVKPAGTHEPLEVPSGPVPAQG